MAGRQSKIPLSKSMKPGTTASTPRSTTATTTKQKSLISPRPTTVPTNLVSNNGTQGAGHSPMDGRYNSSEAPMLTPGRIPIKKLSFGTNRRPTGYANGKVKDSPGSGESASIRSSSARKGPSRIPSQAIKTNLNAQKEQGKVSKHSTDSTVPINFLMPPKAEHFVDCCASSSPFDSLEPIVNDTTPRQKSQSNVHVENTDTPLLTFQSRGFHENHSNSVKVIERETNAEDQENRLTNKDSKLLKECETNEEQHSIGVVSIQDIQPPREIHDVVSDLTVADKILLKTDASLAYTTKYLENEKPPMFVESPTELQHMKGSTPVQQGNEIDTTITDPDDAKCSEVIEAGDEPKVLESRGEKEFLSPSNDDQINNNTHARESNKVLEVSKIINDYETLEIDEIFEIPQVFDCPEVIEVHTEYEDIQVDPLSNSWNISTVLVVEPTDNFMRQDQSTTDEEFTHSDEDENANGLGMNGGDEERQQVTCSGDEDGQINESKILKNREPKTIRDSFDLIEKELLPFMIENGLRSGGSEKEKILPNSEGSPTSVSKESLPTPSTLDEDPETTEEYINLESISPTTNIIHRSNQVIVPNTIILLNQMQPLTYSGEIFIRNRSTQNLIFKLMTPKNDTRYCTNPGMGYVLAADTTQINVQAILESDQDKEEIAFDKLLVLTAPAHSSKISLNQLKDYWKIIQDSQPRSIQSHMIKIELIDVPCPPLTSPETDINSEQEDDNIDTIDVSANMKNQFNSNLNFLNNSIAQVEKDVRTMTSMVDELVHWGSFSVYLSSIAVIAAIAVTNFQNFAPIEPEPPEVQGWFSWIPFLGKKSS